MKIVFEFYGEAQVSFTGKAYHTEGNKKPEWAGASVEGIICDGPSALRSEGDNLYIEGSLTTVRKMLLDILDQLDGIEEDAKAEVEERIARAQLCLACGMWFDTKYNETGHGDGRGMSCLGDGTVMMGNRMITINRPGGFEEDGYVVLLKKGDQFVIREPIGDHEKDRVWEALDDAVKMHGTHWVRVKRDTTPKLTTP